MKSKLAITLAFALAIVCRESQANDFNKLMENFSGVSTRWQDFDRDKVSLATAIDTAQASGQLSKQQADDFRAQLQTLSQQEAQAKATGGVMSFVQSISFNKQFNSLAAQVETAIRQGKVSAPDTISLLSDLRTRIDVMAKAGKLSDADAAAIRSDFNHVSSMEAAFKAESNGTLSPRQSELLLVEINKIKARLDQEEELASSGLRTLEFRKQALDKKIIDGLAQSRLSPADAQKFRDELSKTSERMKIFSAANRKPTGAEVLQIAGDLDTISSGLDARLASSPVPSAVSPQAAAQDEFPERLARLDHRIRRLANLGRLSAQDADEARKDLEFLTSQYTLLKTGNAVPTQSQLNQLNLDLDLLARQVDEGRITPFTDTRGSARNTGPYTYGRGRRSDGSGQLADLGLRDRRGNYHRGSGDADRVQQAEVPPVPRQDEHPMPDPGVQANSVPPSGLSFPIIANKEFTDISGYWAQPYISQLANRGVIGGFPNSTFRPEANITRAQFAAIAAQALKLPAGSGANFVDVKPSHWAASAIGAASNAGLIGGFPDGTFKPEENLTRAQALVILSKALKAAPADPSALNAYTDVQAVPAWAHPSVTQAASARIIVSFPDSHQIRPNALTTRGEVAGLMYQTLSALGADLPRITIGLVESR